MGDGGVACVASQNVMEQFSVSESVNGKFGTKVGKKLKKKMKSKGEGITKKTEGKKVEHCLDSKVAKEEIEEGELGTLKWPTEVENGEYVPGKVIKSEIERGGGGGSPGGERWARWEPEKEDSASGKWRKHYANRGEFSSGRDGNNRYRKREGSWRGGSKNDIERGEFVPDRWHKRRDDVVRDDDWECEREWTPPPGKYVAQKELPRSAGPVFKRYDKWEPTQKRNPRLGSKIVVEDSSLNNNNSTQHSNGKNHLKRQSKDFDNADHKHYGGYNDSYTSSKMRRISEDSEPPMRRVSRNSNVPSDRYSSRHYESPVPSRVSYEKHDRSPRHHDRSPRHSEGSPHEWDKYPDHRDRSPPIRRDRSPSDRERYYDYRDRSPSYSEWSPNDRGRYRNQRDRTPNEPSSLVKGRQGKKTGQYEKRQSNYGGKKKEEKADKKDPQAAAKESRERSNLQHESENVENKSEKKLLLEEQSKNEGPEECPQAKGAAEELLSMEEDMDICDTPPHVPAVMDSSSGGKWVYLDHFGVERGPTKLGDLKTLVEGGYLVSDHLIKHLDSDRWVTVEKAASPLVTLNLPSVITADSITRMVSPPQAPGNLLVDVGDSVHCANVQQSASEEKSPEPKLSPDKTSDVYEVQKNFCIEDRVGALLAGFTVTPGQELEAVAEALQVKFADEEGQITEESEGVLWCWFHSEDQHDQGTGIVVSQRPETEMVEVTENSSASSDKDTPFAFCETSDLLSGHWSCKGGDWKRFDESAQDGYVRKRFVLNDGYPLCQMSNSGYEDPRWHLKDELYQPSHSRRLDLPPWAFSLADEGNDSSSGSSRSNQLKPVAGRGIKGSMLPVVRINLCVVKDHGSFVSEPRMKVRGKDRQTSRSSRAHSGAGDMRRSSEERGGQSTHVHEKELRGSYKSNTYINIPKDRLCTTDDLQLHLGDWYYLDGAGHEQGPLSFSELQVLADQGVIRKSSSVFRKQDKVWVPVTTGAVSSSRASVKEIDQIDSTHKKDSGAESTGLILGRNSSFHSLYPQFIGFTRGKLHELVMKSYKSREFAAAINEVLDPWINAKQPKKELDKFIPNSSMYNSYRGSDKRARMLPDGSVGNCAMEDELVGQNEVAFDDLCENDIFHRADIPVSEIESASWGVLDGHVLARIFHHLRTDIKSLVHAALTCKHWKDVSTIYKDITRKVDLSSLGLNCTDSIVWSVMTGYRKEKITSLVLFGCTNISSGVLERVIQSFPGLSSLDIRGCSQLIDLADKFPTINWIKSRSLQTKSLKNTSLFRTYNEANMDDSSGLKDYFESVERRDTTQLFHKSLYKRSKLFDARRSSSIISREARLRRWALKKSENSYKKMEEFLTGGIKDIMKENTFDFFVPKVAEIEDRMKNGYYSARGLSSVKEDISRMCRDAIKAKNRGEEGDTNHIVTLFIRLAAHLDDRSKNSYEKEELMKNWKDDSSVNLGSGNSKYKRRKIVLEKKTVRSNGTSFMSGSFDYGDNASDREIRKRLSKLNKKTMDSGSETSDELDKSSEETETDSESSVSDSDRDSDSQSGSAFDSRDGSYITEDGLDSINDDREWGARMTKASLVPPVTRKYDVIDKYVIVADEDEVKRKMQVSLPDNYAEKLTAQKNGTEESDMEIPEVKDYKPRKQLGIEVLEQEVYGVDPYTHNLLLDSMKDGLDWTLKEKHIFIEDVLLRTLNRQVRRFTGSGNTPMVYKLRPVIEDILNTAEQDHEVRILQICKSILKAIDSRPDDSYVAYRKGLGVVCDKEGGFSKDDFVVEFLGEVYPAWKWFEKQDGVRSFQKDSKDAPEFYNIYLERPKGDADGYDIVVVDAMHKANYASRICHSCSPNCEAKVTAVAGQYQIGIYAVRPIEYGEEITFDYNSVTESKEEYEASVCLCGSQVCRGSYLNLTGEGAYQKVLKEWHGLLDRYQMLLEACELNFVSDEDYIDLGKAGLGSCLLAGLPDWLIAYTARLVRFINFERTKLPQEILRHNLEEKRKYFVNISIDDEKNDAEIQAEGVYNQRLQNLALTLDKVRYVMRRVYEDPKEAPPPLERLSPQETASFLWKGEGSFVDELLQCIAPYMDDSMLKELKLKIRAHDPSGSDDIQKELRKSLRWLRDEVRDLPCTYKCRHDAAADLIHIYAYTKCFFRVREYKTVTSPPVYISPLDLGPKFADKLASGLHEYRKAYSENYCLGQLIFWHNQADAEPDCNLAKASKGCLQLPEIDSFYAKVHKPSRQRVYGPRTLKLMLARMEKQSQRPWPSDRIWSFKDFPKTFGSPMLDSVLDNTPLDKEMVHWLKHRPAIFQANWDR